MEGEKINVCQTRSLARKVVSCCGTLTQHLYRFGGSMLAVLDTSVRESNYENL